jgi:hypothetical protein
MLTVTKLSHEKPFDTNGNRRAVYVIQEVTPTGSHRVAVLKDGPAGNTIWRTSYPDAVWMGEYPLPAKTFSIYRAMSHE